MVLPVDAVDAFGVVSTRITVAFVHVDFAIFARSTSLTDALITVNKIMTDASKLARIRFAFVYLRLAQVTSVTWLTRTTERIFSIDALAVFAWR